MAIIFYSYFFSARLMLPFRPQRPPSHYPNTQAAWSIQQQVGLLLCTFWQRLRVNCSKTFFQNNPLWRGWVHWVHDEATWTNMDDVWKCYFFLVGRIEGVLFFSHIYWISQRNSLGSFFFRLFPKKWYPLIFQKKTWLPSIYGCFNWIMNPIFEQEMVVNSQTSISKDWFFGVDRFTS